MAPHAGSPLLAQDADKAALTRALSRELVDKPQNPCSVGRNGARRSWGAHLGATSGLG
jgi:hypothetical protein